jgi:hypothetical protein
MSRICLRDYGAQNWIVSNIFREFGRYRAQRNYFVLHMEIHFLPNFPFVVGRVSYLEMLTRYFCSRSYEFKFDESLARQCCGSGSGLIFRQRSGSNSPFRFAQIFPSEIVYNCIVFVTFFISRSGSVK